MIISRRHLGAIHEFDSNERDALGNILKRLTTRYDNLFQTSFPYSMSILNGISMHTFFRLCCVPHRP
jgi:UDPglucose--hexose-1-phosphate uridylyltransferase